MSVKTNGQKTSKALTRKASIDDVVDNQLKGGDWIDNMIAACRRWSDEGLDVLEQLRGKGIDPRYLDDLPNPVSEIVQRQRVEKMSMKATVELPVWAYGYFAAAAAVHNITWQEVVQLYLEENITEWANQNYILPNLPLRAE